jgi:transcriptional regulator with XRE-family HTH domain
MPVLKRLRELRYRAGLKQTELADRAHVARTTVIRLERGDPNAEPTTIRRLARALKVSIPELIGD